MKKVIRLTEGDLVRIVKKVLKEQTKGADGQPMSQQKKVFNTSNLLDNKGETYNKEIGVKVLPNCFRYSSDVQKAGIFPSEIDILVDKLDFPMNERDVQHATQWSQGNGFPGMMGGEGNYGDLNMRVVNKDGLWYPAVEDLRVKYNLDESFEDLGSISKKKELVKFRNALLQAYQYWIDCMNKTDHIPA
jgi:hypothetical protein